MNARAIKFVFELIARAILQNENSEILLINKAGKWILPGGKIDFHEMAENCIARKIKEQLNLKFSPRFLGYKEDFKSSKERHAMILYFLGEYSGELKIRQDNIMQAKYFAPGEIKKSKEIGYDHKDVLKTYLEASGK